MFRHLLLFTISLLFFKNMAFCILLGDRSTLVPAFIHILLIYLIVKNHSFTAWAVRAWAIIYLLIFTGIKAGAKTLIIIRGDAWEINTARYYADLFLVIIGIMVAIFDEKIFLKK